VTLAHWRQESGLALGNKQTAIVVALSQDDLPSIDKITQSRENTNQIISLIVPFNLENPDTSVIEKILSSSSVPISLSTVFNKATPEGVAGLQWALKQGRPVDIDIQAVLSNTALEGFEDMILKAKADVDPVPPIILSNVLPPPHDLELPIVKLMNHPTYLAFQSQIAALSLFPSVSIKFLPPSWNAPTPHTPLPGTTSDDSGSKQQKEWKRRIKMYLGPVMEAFGYERIIFGSSPSIASTSVSNASDWYEIARESFAELGVEQEFVNAVFYENAKTAYGNI